MDLDRLANADELRKIRETREPIYGPHRDNHQNIGAAWGGILRASGWTPPGDRIAVAPDVVELMQAALKLVRAAFPGARFHADNYNDAVNYVQMAGELKAEDAGRAVD